MCSSPFHRHLRFLRPCKQLCHLGEDWPLSVSKTTHGWFTYWCFKQRMGVRFDLFLLGLTVRELEPPYQSYRIASQIWSPFSQNIVLAEQKNKHDWKTWENKHENPRILHKGGSLSKTLMAHVLVPWQFWWAHCWRVQFRVKHQKRTLYSHHFGEQKISLPFPEPSPPKKEISASDTSISAMDIFESLRFVTASDTTWVDKLSCPPPPHDTKAVIAGTLHEVPSKNAYWWTRTAATNPTQVVFMPGLERKSLENGEFNKHLFPQHNFFDHFWFSSRF